MLEETLQMHMDEEGDEDGDEEEEEEDDDEEGADELMEPMELTSEYEARSAPVDVHVADHNSYW